MFEDKCHVATSNTWFLVMMKLMYPHSQFPPEEALVSYGGFVLPWMSELRTGYCLFAQSHFIKDHL